MPGATYLKGPCKALGMLVCARRSRNSVIMWPSAELCDNAEVLAIGVMLSKFVGRLAASFFLLVLAANFPPHPLYRRRIGGIYDGSLPAYHVWFFPGLFKVSAFQPTPGGLPEEIDPIECMLFSSSCFTSPLGRWDRSRGVGGSLLAQVVTVFLYFTPT